MIEVLKNLPKMNCKKCGAPTCMVFATQVVEGGKDAGKCTELTDEQSELIEEYLASHGVDYHKL